MKTFLIWVVACAVLGIGSGMVYLNLPSVKQPRIDAYLTNGTPSASAKLARMSFQNAGHKYSVEFYSDGRVETGTLAKRANQQAVLARPGHEATSYVMFAAPIDNAQAAERVDCGTNNAANVEFTVNLSGQTVSVCHDPGTGGHAVYTMNVRSTGTWEQVTFFDNGLADLKPNDAAIKMILGSLVID